MEKTVGLQEDSHTKVGIRKTASVKQKNTKLEMERRRRARINRSVDTLKSLVLKNTNRDVSQFARLEKADVLEMVVHYVENLQKVRSPNSPKPPLVVKREMTGADAEADVGGTSEPDGLRGRQGSKRRVDRPCPRTKRRVLGPLENLPPVRDEKATASVSPPKKCPTSLTSPKQRLSNAGLKGYLCVKKKSTQLSVRCNQNAIPKKRHPVVDAVFPTDINRANEVATPGLNDNNVTIAQDNTCCALFTPGRVRANGSGKENIDRVVMDTSRPASTNRSRNAPIPIGLPDRIWRPW